jgi:hypothetical protein
MTAPLRKQPAAVQSPLRALTLFETLPPGHKTLPVEDNGSFPHLKVGEYAVIDTTDVELQKGEMYVIQHESGSRSRHIIQIKADVISLMSGRRQSVWWVCDLAGFRRVCTLPSEIPLLGGMSDGPYTSRQLQKKLLGRVVGYSETALHGLLAACAELA